MIRGATWRGGGGGGGEGRMGDPGEKIHVVTRYYA